MADDVVSIDIADTGTGSRHDRDRKRTPVRSRADGGVVAQLRLDHPDLFLRSTLRRAPDVSIELEYWTAVGDRTLVFLTASGDTFDEFESALEVDPTVADPVLLDCYPDRRIYRVEIDDATVTGVDRLAAIGAYVLAYSSCQNGDSYGWQIQLRFPSREDLVEFNSYCDDRGISVTVDHLRVSDDGDDGVVALTEKQQDLLTAAYEEGYFDVPRDISQDELAQRFDISKSAVSQRLRRAVRELCGAALS
ncbi:helix-turn-helix domain-containing protein [Natronobacterium gregoryi]|uniref:Bacterio-opsin activator n=2 Tax=Natronobacterium gregoryi TaxID=44930 RepID=L0AMN6_NATGS|nr:helix-turn-helix domain-containing protein [Natronobacterium gregoryi]AFZ74462.1 putative DNA binding protein [Natronobacterium gregoryi SP2]ELY72240.1 bacterio-opsin activator HTH domain-containing protein [Natronobacterium gregoryi SP2]PLK21790.1 bacterio-opsin activator [Natronobacterium gregoryi SP2]SFJ46162.1 Predicted DNA binding protein, contains HTH domain [Natronobacterium gregoryi]